MRSCGNAYDMFVLGQQTEQRFEKIHRYLLQKTRWVFIHRVPEKPSHFNFRHNFATCSDMFTIFKAPCLGLISALYSVLRTHHRCEAFT